MQLEVNGVVHTIDVDDDALLLDVLRESLGLKGALRGCGIGACGACTVLVDGTPVPSCILLARKCEGSRVRTVEDLVDEGSLSVLQQAFVDEGGFQCGACTSGQLMTATALMARKERLNRDDIEFYMVGNLCRCTGYAGIVRSVLRAVDIGCGAVDGNISSDAGGSI